MIAGAKTIAATPSPRRCAEIGRPLFAAADAILAVILCPRKWVAPSNKIRGHRNPAASKFQRMIERLSEVEFTGLTM